MLNKWSENCGENIEIISPNSIKVRKNWKKGSSIRHDIPLPMCLAELISCFPHLLCIWGSLAIRMALPSPGRKPESKDSSLFLSPIFSQSLQPTDSIYRICSILSLPSSGLPHLPYPNCLLLQSLPWNPCFPSCPPPSHTLRFVFLLSFFKFTFSYF